MEEKKQELVIKITNRVIEVKLDDGTSPGLYLLCHYLNDNTFDNVKEMDDFIKFLAKILQVVPKDVGDRITKFAFDAVAEALQNKLQKELTNIRVNPDGRKDITIQKAETKKNYEERTVFNIKAEEDMKKIINFVFADMKYHDLLEDMEHNEKDKEETFKRR